MHRRKTGAIVMAVVLASVVAGVIAHARSAGHEPTATGDELRGAAQRVLAATGGLWTTIGPSSTEGTWEAAVVKPDLTTATVILNERFHVVSVTSEPSVDARAWAAVTGRPSGPVYD
jgi:hypothetical protein